MHLKQFLDNSLEKNPKVEYRMDASSYVLNRIWRKLSQQICKSNEVTDINNFKYTNLKIIHAFDMI